jgi:hypothetical protein
MSESDHNVPEDPHEPMDTPAPGLRAAPTAPQPDLKAAPTAPAAPDPDLKAAPTAPAPGTGTDPSGSQDS